MKVLNTCKHSAIFLCLDDNINTLCICLFLFLIGSVKCSQLETSLVGAKQLCCEGMLRSVRIGIIVVFYEFLWSPRFTRTVWHITCFFDFFFLVVRITEAVVLNF